jgi:hypothetical protein
MTTENAIELVKKYAQPARSSFGGELDYKIIPSKQFYHLANEIAEKVNTYQDEVIILHKILYKILNEGKPTYNVKEQAKIKQIIDEHLNEK